jgi:hypothetical protein
VPALKVFFELAGFLDNGHFKGAVALAASDLVRIEEIGWFHGGIS